MTSVDPSLASARRQTPQSWNRYSYGINNPLKYVDPSGEVWIHGPKGEIFWDGEVKTQEEVTKKYGKGYKVADGKQLIIREPLKTQG